MIAMPGGKCECNGKIIKTEKRRKHAGRKNFGTVVGRISGD
jgi:hypothetical protein